MVTKQAARDKAFRAEFAATLAAASNTDNLIAWGALREQRSAMPEPLTDKERCRLLVRLANGEKITLRQWGAFIGAPTVRSSRPKRIGLRDLDKRGVGWLLHLRISGSPAEVAEQRDDLAKQVSDRVVVLPRLGHVAREDAILARDLKGAIFYAVWLFHLPSQTRSRSLGEDLRRCQLEECERFFLIDRRAAGRPRDTYCCDEHLEEAHRRKVRERVARHRAENPGRRRK